MKLKGLKRSKIERCIKQIPFTRSSRCYELRRQQVHERVKQYMTVSHSSDVSDLNAKGKRDHASRQGKAAEERRREKSTSAVAKWRNGEAGAQGQGRGMHVSHAPTQSPPPSTIVRLMVWPRHGRADGASGASANDQNAIHELHPYQIQKSEVLPLLELSEVRQFKFSPKTSMIFRSFLQITHVRSFSSFRCGNGLRAPLPF